MKTTTIILLLILSVLSATSQNLVWNTVQAEESVSKDTLQLSEGFVDGFFMVTLNIQYPDTLKVYHEWIINGKKEATSLENYHLLSERRSDIKEITVIVRNREQEFFKYSLNKKEKEHEKVPIYSDFIDYGINNRK